MNALLEASHCEVLHLIKSLECLVLLARLQIRGTVNSKIGRANMCVFCCVSVPGSMMITLIPSDVFVLIVILLWGFYLKYQWSAGTRTNLELLTNREMPIYAAFNRFDNSVMMTLAAFYLLFWYSMLSSSERREKRKRTQKNR